MIRWADHLIEIERSYDSAQKSREFFDLEQDPGERKNLATVRESDADGLGASVTSEVDRLVEASTWPAPMNVIDEMDEEHLRALGYVE